MRKCLCNPVTPKKRRLKMQTLPYSQHPSFLHHHLAQLPTNIARAKSPLLHHQFRDTKTPAEVPLLALLEVQNAKILEQESRIIGKITADLVQLSGTLWTRQ
jgi:hypothetical protein